MKGTPLIQDYDSCIRPILLLETMIKAGKQKIKAGRIGGAKIIDKTEIMREAKVFLPIFHFFFFFLTFADSQNKELRSNSQLW